MRLSLLAACLLLAACSPADNDPGPGGVTVDEATALREAAEMIEPEPSSGSPDAKVPAN